MLITTERKMNLQKNDVQVGNKLRLKQKRLWGNSKVSEWETRDSVVEITNIVKDEWGENFRFEYKFLDMKRHNALPNAKIKKNGVGGTSFIIFDKKGNLREQYKDQYFLLKE
jgi:hypothetical protein